MATTTTFCWTFPPAAGMSFSYTDHTLRQYAGGPPIGFRDSAWQQFYGRDVAAYEAFLDDNKDNTKATVLPLTNTPAKTDSPTWTLLHADVFRPPSTMPVLFAVLVGTGAQLFVAVFCTIVLAFCGFLSPTRPGSILVGGLGCYVLSGPVAGFVANSLNRIFSDTDDSNSSWWSCTIMTATLFPLIVLTITVPLNTMVTSVEDAVAIPIMDIVAVVMI